MKLFTYQTPKNITAITTTTETGNMAFQVGDNYSNVKQNRSILAKELNLNIDDFVFVHQSHSTTINEVFINHKCAGRDSFESGIEGDALYTKEKGIALGIFHADCVPVFFYDETMQLIGIIHSGYQGIKKHVVLKTLSEVINKECLNPLNIKVILGPYRHKESFEINEDEISLLKQLRLDKFVFNNHFDMGLAVLDDLFNLGIPKENIIDSNVDTCKNNLCYSAYKKEPIGRMSSLIFIK